MQQQNAFSLRVSEMLYLYFYTPPYIYSVSFRQKSQRSAPTVSCI